MPALSPSPDPHDALVDLLVPETRRGELLERAKRLPPLVLTPRAQCDLELLAVGAFSPVRTFLNGRDYDSVLRKMRLANGRLFPIPVVLPVPDSFTSVPGDEISLRAATNDVLAVMRIDEIFDRQPEEEAKKICGTLDTRHPFVAELGGAPPRCVSGPLEVIELPRHRDFIPLRLSPRQVRQKLQEMKAARVVAFQTRNPIHRAHEWLTKMVAARENATLLVHPVVGVTKPGDVDYFTRVRCYQRLLAESYDSQTTVLALLPLAMRMAGPREALWHALIRKNYGATHFIVGRDHASPGKDAQGRPFYGPYDAQALVRQHETELGIKMVAVNEVVYLPKEGRYEELDKVPSATETQSISGTDVRDKYLARGERLPDWFTSPSVAEILEDAFPPLERAGFCLWFTGLPSSGKSTLAEAVAVFLMERGRRATLLDGDVVRTYLSKGLGFSKEDRDQNILRLGYVSSEIVRHHGVAIVAAISPYEATRNQVRSMMDEGRFVLVHVSTPLEICEQRDVKGIYAAAREGRARGVTGIDDPYEAPRAPDLRIDTSGALTVESSLSEIIAFLAHRGFLVADGTEAERR